VKPKVLVDIAFLGLGFDRKSACRGVERVVANLFEGLLKSEFCDLSFAATSCLAGAYDFLEAKGMAPHKTLRHAPRQLVHSRRARQLIRQVERNLQDRGLLARGLRKTRSLAAQWLVRNEGELEDTFLSDVDIYHMPHTRYPQPYLPACVEQHPRVKKFVTMHDLIALRNPEFFAKDPRAHLKSLLDRLSEKTFAFCVSEHGRAEVLEWTRLRPDRVFVAPLAADPELFYQVKQPDVRTKVLKEIGIPNEPYFLALSVHEPHKNFQHLIRCLGELVQSGELPNGNLVIVGRKATRGNLVENAIKDYPCLAGRVFTTGFVPDDRLAAVYGGAIAFLFPSLAEGFGLPPLEAMQCGAPVIASNTTSIPEVVGSAGLLLSPTDVDGWCQAMLKIYRDDEFRAGFSVKSVERAKLFSWERFIQATIRGYQTSLECGD
jgi:glycosyltransferase involved in cell wall biosynthesis